MSALSGALMIMAAGCGSADDDGSATSAETLAARRPRHGSGGSSGGTGGSTGSGGSAGGCSNIDAIIAAAQTPDGRAIPQPPGPNGQCPQVVVCLGFWSCVNQGDACTFSSGGVTHHCSCVRVDGEGQLPAWTCN